jgi:hypothetical protein
VPYAFPFIPKHFAVHPKKDEMVLIITNDINSPNKRRWYIGPVVSQDYYMDNCRGLFYGKSLLDDGPGDLFTEQPLPNPYPLPKYKGTLPDREDIAVRGRNNADLILKDNEVRLRCGFKLYPYSPQDLRFNEYDLAYIKMKYKREYDPLKNGETYASSINMVADKINLLTHNSGNDFTLTDPDELITDDELNRILKEAQSLPYGNKLVLFLEKLIKAFINHTHPMAMKVPVPDVRLEEVKNFNLDSLLSKNIKIS